VGTTRTCKSGAPGEYTLDLHASFDPGLVLVRDDLVNAGEGTLTVVGSATILPP
jgi:hypothetical protein